MVCKNLFKIHYNELSNSLVNSVVLSLLLLFTPDYMESHTCDSIETVHIEKAVGTKSDGSFFV